MSLVCLSRLARTAQRAAACSRATRTADAGLSMPPDSIGAKKCPKCRSLMSKYRIQQPTRANRLDYCPHCEEIWLDEGEWQLVEGLVSPATSRACSPQAWQYAVRAGVTDAMEEQRLREVLGGDYDRVVQFAEWLQSQPAKSGDPRAGRARDTGAQAPP